MADQTDTTRRGLLVGFGAAIPTLTIAGSAAGAAGDPDRAVREAVARFLEARDVSLAAQELVSEAENRYVEPPVPEALFARPEDYALGLPLPSGPTYGGEYVAWMAEPRPWPEAQARADEIVAAWDAYQDALAEAEEASGIFDVVDDAKATTEALDAARAVLVATPAVTLEGAILKARAATIWLVVDDDDFDDGLARDIERAEPWDRIGVSILRDLIAMGRGAGAAG